ncbi:MAG: hypothetical protein WAV16_02560 [Candidatus Moraniibacteriota bacterium]
MIDENMAIGQVIGSKENKKGLVDLVMDAAQARRDKEVPEGYIEKALEMIASGERNVPMYPTGLPSLRGVYDLAHELMLQY